MSAGRHRGPVVSSRRAVKLTGAGAAGAVGVAAVFGMSPTAQANPPHTTSHHDPGSGAKKSGTGERAVAETATPNYGYQKYRVGVQLKSGAYAPVPAPPDTLTGDTTLTIHATNVDPSTYPDTTMTCTTQDASQDPGTTRTWCTQPQAVRSAQLGELRKIAPRLITQPTPTGAPQNELFVARPGDTITITQTTVEPNLVADTSTATIEPCQANGQFIIVAACMVNPTAAPGSQVMLSTDKIFEDTGLPPQAVNDSAGTGFQQPTTVDVLANDTTQGAPVTGLSVSSPPGHGSANVVSTASGREIRYRPENGFVGTDTFEYTLQTGNGQSTATVTVQVAAPPPTAHDDSAQTTRDHGVDVDVLGNDNPRGQDVTGLRVTSTPGHGRAYVVSTSTGREIRYVPDAGFIGADKFTYTIRTAGGTSEATVSVDVAAPPPIANDDTATTPQGQSVSVAVTANDDQNGGGALTITSTSTPGHGSVRIDGQHVVYTANSNYVGSDSFSYTVQNSGGSATATVHVTVTGSGNLAQTGLDSASLLGIGGLLLGSGAALSVAGRRRRGGRHARA